MKHVETVVFIVGIAFNALTVYGMCFVFMNSDENSIVTVPPYLLIEAMK